MTPARPTAHNRIVLGNAALRAGQYDYAIRYYKEATELEPGNAEAHSSLGCAYANGGYRIHAELPLRRALRLDPANAPALRCLSSILVGNGNVAQALPVLSRYAEVAGETFEPHFKLGMAYRRIGNNPEAATAFARALELNPSHSVALENLGMSLKGAGRHIEACVALQRAARMMPDRADLWCELGECYNQAEKPSAAAEAFRRALTLDCSSARAHHGLGTARYNAGQFKPSCADFAEAVGLEPGRLDYRCDLGRAQFAAGDYQAAALAFGFVRDRQRAHVVALRGLGAAMLGMSDSESAYRYLMEASRSSALDGMTLYYLSILYRRDGRALDAAESCRRAIEADPALYKQVARLDSLNDGMSHGGVRERRAYAEFGGENLKDILAVIKAVKEDGKWLPRRQVTLRAC